MRTVRFVVGLADRGVSETLSCVFTGTDSNIPNSTSFMKTEGAPGFGCIPASFPPFTKLAGPFCKKAARGSAGQGLSGRAAKRERR